jgi:predicted aldo/keto reductase-like oxidoreductase
VYGTTRLGDESVDRGERVAVAGAAMREGIWLHTSDQYGDALDVLREAFEADRGRIPRLIVKIGWSSVEQIRRSIESQMGRLGVDHVDLGQLRLGQPLAEEFVRGECREGLLELRREGLVRGDVRGAAWKDYLRQRAGEVAPLFERSGARSWVEFCVRFAHAQPGVVATVGATLKRDRLSALCELSREPLDPLPDDVMRALSELAYRWSDETDVHAEPWSM